MNKKFYLALVATVATSAIVAVSCAMTYKAERVEHNLGVGKSAKVVTIQDSTAVEENSK